jgi:hypothetical protein
VAQTGCSRCGVPCCAGIVPLRILVVRRLMGGACGMRRSKEWVEPLKAKDVLVRSQTKSKNLLAFERLKNEHVL